MLMMDARSASPDTAAPTLGPYVCGWIERELVHGNGDILGRRVTLTDEERAFIYRAYELNADGSRIIRRALLGLPKGSRKTELAAWLALAELAGPVRFKEWLQVGDDDHVRLIPVPMAVVDPEVICFANSRKQAKRIQDRAGNIVNASPRLAETLKVEQQGITFRDPGRAGILFTVAAEADTIDGYTPSFAVGDESHDMVGRRRDTHGKMRRGIPKRPDSWLLDITTAGDPHEASIARDLHARAVQLSRATPDEVGRWLTWWRTCEPELLRIAEKDVDPLKQPEEWERVVAARRKAVAQANPEPWKDHEAILDELGETPFGEWARYYLNAWVTQDEHAFARAGAWESRYLLSKPNAARLEQLVDAGEVILDANGRPHPAPGAKVWLGFDGSRSRDATALVGVTASRFAFVVRAWEASPEPDWMVPEAEVDAVVRDVFDRYDVQELWADPWGSWGDKWLGEWAAEFGDHRVLANPMSRERIGPQVIGLWRGIHADETDLTHDGDPALWRHVHNALMHETRHGGVLEKRGGKDSVNWIDVAVALTYADDARMKSLTRRGTKPQFFFPGLDEEHDDDDDL